MPIENRPPITARRLASTDDEDWCARLMSTSEPWLTLGRDYDDSIAVLRDPNTEVYVAHEAGERVGFVILSLSGVLNGYIRTVAIAPSHRDRGIGTQLMTIAETRIFEGSPNAFVSVTSFNHRARALYERLGYEFVGELSDFFVRGVSELLYRKTRGPWSEFTRDRSTTVSTKE
jgi:[ribosomal protein S18]-alanine N-acetyltransferase